MIGEDTDKQTVIKLDIKDLLIDFFTGAPPQTAFLDSVLRERCVTFLLKEGNKLP